MLAIVSSPPDVVSVGQLFEVSVFVGLAASAPLPNFAVSLSITPSSLGSLLESVDDFIARLSGDPVDYGSCYTPFPQTMYLTKPPSSNTHTPAHMHFNTYPRPRSHIHIHIHNAHTYTHAHTQTQTHTQAQTQTHA